MKIRADFVTNSSSSSYVDVYADNPVLNELLEKYYGSTGDAYTRYTTDWCNEHEDLEYSESLLEFLNMAAGTRNAELRKEIEEKKAAIVRNFRYAKYNTGYHYTDGYLSGEEHHITLSSRWGVIDQHTYIDEDEEDADWGFIETEVREKPTEETAGFEGARPEDLKKRTDLSENMKMVLDKLSEEPVVLKDKKFVFMGDYDQYTLIASDAGSDDESDEEDWDDWEDEEEDPWEDRETSYSVKKNIPEIKMMSFWLSPLGGEIRSIGQSGKIGKADYLVVRLDSWAEGCIDPKAVKKAVSAKIPIISEYRFWKAIFG